MIVMEILRARPYLGLIIIGLITFTVVFVFLRQKKTHYRELELGGVTYRLEIADTPAKRAEGLMGRKRLDENEGMLFIFPTKGKHSFWMYNTLIPLDIIWLDGDWNVVHVEKNVPPCESANPIKCPSYRPDKPAKYVVELNANTF
jgi:uncharacterized protein